MQGNIHISILGNPLRTAGARPLCVSQGCPFSLDYTGLPGVDRAPFAIEVKVLREYTLYKLYCNNVRTSDGEKGTLIFGVSIPARCALANNATPFDLLMDLRQMFANAYMQPTPMALVPDSYTYQTPTYNIIDNSFLQPLFMKYQISLLQSPYHVMSGNSTAMLQLDNEKMRCFLRDVHCYSELSTVGRVVVASDINGASYDNNLTGKLEIPRERRYTISIAQNPNLVILGGVSNGVVKKRDFDKTIRISSGEDERYYNVEIREFSINGLLAGQEIDGVSIDHDNELIYSNIKGTEKKFTIKVDVRIPFYPAPDIKDIYSRLVITLDGQVLPVAKEGFCLYGRNYAARGRIMVKCPDLPGYEQDGQPRIDNDVLTLKYRKVDKPKFTAATSTSTSGTYKLVAELSGEKVDDFSKECANGCWIRVESSGVLLLEKKVLKPTLIGKPGKSKVYSTELELPAEYKNKKVSLALRNNDKMIKSKNEATVNSELIKFRLNSDDMETLAKPKNFYSNFASYSLPIFIVATIVLSIICFSAGDEVIQGDKSVILPIPNPDVPENSGDSGESEQERLKKEKLENAEKFFKKADKVLENKDLKFEEVTKLYTEYQDSAYAGLDKNFEESEERLIAYNEVVSTLELCNTQDERKKMTATVKKSIEETLKSYTPDNERLDKLHKNHKSFLLMIYWGDVNKGKEYANEPRFGKSWGVVYMLSSGNRSSYTSFKDLGAFSGRRDYMKQPKVGAGSGRRGNGMDRTRR